MKLKFLGGAEEVGSLGMLMYEGSGVLLFDYGMTPTSPPGFPLPSPPVDRMFLSHSHVDHSGMIPWLCGRYDTEVIATPPTIDVAELLLEDSLKISLFEGYELGYDGRDITTTKKRFNPIDFGTVMDVQGLEVSVHSAGHVPGAAMYEVNGKDVTVFTGDINTHSTRLVKGTKPVKCNNLIVESTYGGRDHPERLKTEHAFLKKVEEVVGRGGKAIIPTFAVGRTQEVLLLLSQEGYDVWLDGMGRAVNRIYMDYPEYMRDGKELRRAIDRVNIVRSRRGRELAMEGEVIVTTSGMLEGGPVLTYIGQLKNDRNSAVLLAGYQVEGTNGRLLMEEGKLNIAGSVEDINCEVCFFDLSAHAGHKELLGFIRDCEPEKVVLCHGDNREAMAKELEGEFEIFLPKRGDFFEI